MVQIKLLINGGVAPSVFELLPSLVEGGKTSFPVVAIFAVGHQSSNTSPRESKRSSFVVQGIVF
jgi:hypothetical protein